MAEMLISDNLSSEFLRKKELRLTFFLQDADGKINFEEFSQVIGERSSKSDIAELLTVDKAAI